MVSAAIVSNPIVNSQRRCWSKRLGVFTLVLIGHWLLAYSLANESNLKVAPTPKLAVSLAMTLPVAAAEPEVPKPEAAAPETAKPETKPIAAATPAQTPPPPVTEPTPPPVVLAPPVLTKKLPPKNPKPLVKAKPVAPKPPLTPRIDTAPQPITPPVVTPTPKAQATPAKATNPTPAKPAPSRQAVNLAAAYLSNKAPAYPAMSRRMQEEGTVYLRVYVSAQGRAERVELKTSSGSTRLDNAAISAVQQWRFQPAQEADVAIASEVIVPIRFNLNQ